MFVSSSMCFYVIYTVKVSVSIFTSKQGASSFHSFKVATWQHLPLKQTKAEVQVKVLSDNR